MKTIAVIIADLFEDSEYTEPAKAFRDAGYELCHIGLKAGETVKGKKKGTKVFIDSDFSEVDPRDYTALLIPGGYSPDKLRADDSAVNFTKRFLSLEKPVFVICHGPQILITADVIRGRKITGWKSIIKDIENAGAEFIDEEVVVDKNIISSRQPDDLPAFIDAALKKLMETGK
ncbi:MAG: type 1 glutamine amidotransferase [Deltaproteobacteria bacterium]|nr:type 1 glutamine amidotransferase [Deltaproteobacteria bacterium]